MFHFVDYVFHGVKRARLKEESHLNVHTIDTFIEVSRVNWPLGEMKGPSIRFKMKSPIQVQAIVLP